MYLIIINGFTRKINVYVIIIVYIFFKVKKNYFIEEMLKNKHNFIFEQLSPMDIPGPLFDGLKSLYSNYTERIDMLPKHLVSIY